ncbi:MAG: methionine--tRNA ligase, partial [Promethearchaeota archaeon]
NISYDNYTHTHNPTHIKFVQEFYSNIQKNGFVVEKEHEAYYCPEDNFFLPDRFIEGTCPYCNEPGARGDQCDNPACGKVLEPEQLIDPHCKICMLKDENKITVPIKKKTKHWYLDFPKIQEKIKDFINKNKIIPPNSRTMCLNSIEKGIPQRSITRDLKWGIPAGPAFKGAEEKTIYVWFEAVLGYISAVKEWAEKIKKKPELFRYFWNDPDCRSVYFIGKDNIIFHLLVFPGLLFCYNENKKEEDKFPLPYNVSSTEWLNYEKDKFSKSRGIGIWTDEVLELAPVDYWRFSLVRNRPEGRDVSFHWTEFENNVNEMNDKIGNFVHRTLTFIFKRFDGKIPPIIELDKEDKRILSIIKKAPTIIGDLIEQFKLKDALGKIVEIAGEGNTYLNDKAPWRIIKEDKGKAGQVFNISIQLSRCLAILLAPFCPESSEKILKNIGNTEKFSEIVWDNAGDISIQAGQKINKPVPVFSKINLKEILIKLKKIRESNGESFQIPESINVLKIEGSKDKEKNDLDKLRINGEDKNRISYKFFQKFKFKTARIQKVEKLSGNKGMNKYKITATVGKNKEKEFLIEMKETENELKEYIGKDAVFVENLESLESIPLEINKSKGLLLSAQSKKRELLLITDDSVAPGSSIR